MSRIKNPQEKKRLSLERDRRNTYGENDKASRTNVPRAKSRVNRANRHADTITLGRARGPHDEELALDAEQRLLGRRRKVWRKWPDQPFGLVLARKGGDLPDEWFLGQNPYR